ncbi:MAG: hypothetical protein WBD75_03895, partial [Phycisphaerae bacterium]
GIPFGGEALPDVKKLEALLRRPPEQRRLTAEDENRYVEILPREGAGDLGRVVALSLAYGTQPRSLETLRTEAQRLNAPHLPPSSVGGAASYAVAVREAQSRGPEERFGLLCYRLGRSANPWERMFLANRLAVDYGRRAGWVLLEAARAERPPEGAEDRSDERFAQFVMLHALVHMKDDALARAVLQEDWSKAYGGFLAEQIQYLMVRVSPYADADSWRSGTSGLLDIARRTAESAAPEAPSGPKPRE